MPRREEETSPRPEELHLDEGTAHAWLDGALAPDEAARVAAHVAGCAPCAALVAEAQGFLAGASRILGALDAVPGGVVPRDPAREAARDAALSAALAAAAAERRPTERARRAWFAGVPARAAAVVLVVAGLAATLARVGGRTESVDYAASAASADSSAAPMADAAVAGGPRTEDQAEAAPPARALGDSRLGRERAPMLARPRVAMDASAPAAAPLPAPAPAAPPAPTPPAAQRLASNRSDVAAKGVVAGRVTSAAGAPVPGAEVFVAGRPAERAVTDDSGRFALRVAPGAVDVRTRREGFAPREAAVAVAADDTTRLPLVLRPTARVAESVLAGVAAAPAPAATAPTAPAPAASRALAAARSDSAVAERRMEQVVGEASRKRAVRVLAAAGCYALSAEPGGPSPFGVARVALDERPTTLRAGRQSYAARLLPAGSAAEWTPLPGDSLRVAWPSGGGSVVLRLAPAGGLLRGTAQSIGADGVAGAAQGVVARRASCEPDPVR